MSKSPLVTTARVVCYINGHMVGKVAGFRWSSETPRRAIHGLDSAVPFELAPGLVRVTGSLNLYRLQGDGGAEGLGMVAHANDVVRERYFTLTLVERATDTVLFRADYCSVQSQSWDLPLKGVVQGTLSFSGILWSNEVEGGQ